MPSKTGTPPEQQDADGESEPEVGCAPRVRGGNTRAGDSQQCDVSCAQQGSVIGCFLPMPYKAANQECSRPGHPDLPATQASPAVPIASSTVPLQARRQPIAPR